MKKILLSILSAFLLVSPAFGWQTSYRHVEPETAAYGALTSTTGTQFDNNELVKKTKYGTGNVYAGVGGNLSTVAGTQFWTNPTGVDPRLFVGHTVTFTAGGKTLIAQILSAGTGETLGAENATSWTNNTGFPFETLTVNANGHDLDAVIETGTDGRNRVNNGITVDGKLMKVVTNITINSGGISLGLMYSSVIDIGGGASLIKQIIPANPAGAFSTYFTGATGTTYLGFRTGTAVNFAATFSLKPVLTPSASGVWLNIISNDGITGNEASWTTTFTKHLTEVASGAATLANTKISSVAAGAFIDFADASKFQLGDFLVVNDSANKQIGGWLQAFGTGERKAAATTLTGITKASPGIVTYQAGHGYVGGELIYFSGLTQMTSLNTAYRNLFTKSGDTFQLGNLSSQTAAETTGGTCSERVISPSVTGAVITFSKDSGAQSFTVNDTTFNPNDASGYTYKRYR
jgi:hypothetical protein